MKKLITLLLSILFLQIITSKIYAVEDPLKLPNNKIGIHILFPDELEQAAKLVNSNGGDWGYVTIPIQIGDRDIDKWQNFLDRTREYHLIPLIRLASEGDYFNTQVWERPKDLDIIDFANFLDSLNWSTKNRYIIIFNEPNRGDEWGGAVDPGEYAEILQFAVTVFKSKNPDYFIISAGMDNAAPEQQPLYMNEYNYLLRMQEKVPGIFEQIDGFASHSYPNPGFAQPPEILTSKSIASFKYEREQIMKFRNKDIPVFITETGWNASFLSDKTKAEFYKIAFNDVWKDQGIAAITPFLLKAGGGPFQGFSFLNAQGNITEQYKIIMSINKIAGAPALNPETYVLGTEKIQNQKIINGADFDNSQFESDSFSISDSTQKAFRWIMKL